MIDVLSLIYHIPAENLRNRIDQLSINVIIITMKDVSGLQNYSMVWAIIFSWNMSMIAAA